MPWPVTHVLTAEIFFEPFFSHLAREPFIVGTCFPDIRYPAKLPRPSTHIKHLSIAEIQNETPFQAGLLFHSYVDEMWNDMVLHKNSRIFTDVPHDQAMIHTMKILQDRCLYHHLNDWDQVADYFDDILCEERTFGVDEGMIRQWHVLLAGYFRKPPVVEDLDMLSISLPTEMLDKITQYYLTFQDHQNLNRVLTDYYDQALEIYQELLLSIDSTELSPTEEG